MLLFGCLETGLVGWGRRGRGRAARTTRAAGSIVMMGFDFGEDRRDIWIGGNHGRIHLFLEGLELGLFRISRRRARLMRCPQGLSLGFEAGISRDGRIVGLFEFGPFGFGQESQAVGAAGGRTRRRRVGGILSLCKGWADENCPQCEEKKGSFHYSYDTRPVEMVTHLFALKLKKDVITAGQIRKGSHKHF